MLKKNEIVRLMITDMSSEGLGIGHVAPSPAQSDSPKGVTVFVKDTVIGDEAEVIITRVKKTYAFGRLQKVLTPSADRIRPRCPLARRCGGCQLQMMRYEAQLRFKQKRVQDALERIGGFRNVTALPIIGMEDPWNYRNKAQYPVGKGRNGNTVCGFYAGRTHDIISFDTGNPNDRCVIGAPTDPEICSIVLEHMKQFSIEPYDETDGTGLVRHILIRAGRETGQIMVCLILNGKSLPAEKQLVDSLLSIPGMTCIAINTNHERTNVILGEQTRILYGNGYIEEIIDDIRYQISPLSFFQVNPIQTKILYQTALSYAGLCGEETVLDLYCGTGTISLFLARKCKKVIGVEIIEQAVADARVNALRNGITNAEFFAGKTETIIPQFYNQGHRHAHVIVVDPPRKGCDLTALETIRKMHPDRIVYVSCDPATLARDLKILCAGTKYRVVKVQPVDMFPHTVHTECVVKLTRAGL